MASLVVRQFEITNAKVISSNEIGLTGCSTGRQMTRISAPQRVRIAHAATDVIERRVKFFDFCNTLTEEELDDDLVDELVDLIGYEPRVGGWLGTSPEKHKQYMTRVHELIALLKETSE